ncbi:MAG: RNA polymerase sigma factor [Bacteroidales bacterium]|nr:RNA polymerase sigma factor [Bacteroidales bacterium]MBR6066806.1 RNA polymerase sigma factor [Bacteroidales bacterium]
MTREDYNIMVNKYADNVYRFVLSNIKDSELAQDIVQDSFAKLWTNRDEVDNAKSFLFKVAYNRMIDVTRHEKFSTAEDAIGTGYEPGEYDSNSELKEILENALAKLPEQQRQLILLRDYEGYSYNEIGEITGLNETQVKVYIFRARKVLKDYIVKMENAL